MMMTRRPLKIEYDMDKLEASLKEADEIEGANEGISERMSDLKSLNESLDDLLAEDDWAEQGGIETDAEADDEHESAVKSSDVDMNPSDDAWDSDCFVPPDIPGYETRGYKLSNSITPATRLAILKEVSKIIEDLRGDMVIAPKGDTYDYYLMFPDGYFNNKDVGRKHYPGDRIPPTDDPPGADKTPEGLKTRKNGANDDKNRRSVKEANATAQKSNKLASEIWETGVVVIAKDGKSKLRLKPDKLYWERVEWFKQWDEKNMETLPRSKIIQHLIRKTPMRLTYRRKYILE
ncbi:phosphoprotein [Dolphin rhabdovirus]|uniref:Phosphoprotein n=1 Tax=Dolphin rhabdovirus TaxID=1511639 RepID=A0A068ESU6_9RHAB|nr:phosphoprotein [Dolphin rhabdovirus]AID53189.1 phosphoprotein [Dolphin rhabdovirus]